MGVNDGRARLPFLFVLAALACSAQRMDVAPGADVVPGPRSSEPYEMASVDERCDGDGPTGASILAATRPRYDGTFTVRETGAETPLTATVEYRGGPIRCEPAILAAPGMGMPDVPARVDVEVEIGFATADGQLAERLVTWLTGAASGGVGFSRSIAEADLVGTFDPGLRGYEDVAVTIYGTFDGGTAAGYVGTSGTRPGMASEGSPFVASWNAAVAP